MNRLNWTYPSDSGKNYNIGLLHWPRLGHLLVYCNAKIVLIDYKVLKTTSYSLFVEDELFDLEIERKGDQFFYSLEINEAADTPRNRFRKKQERQHWRKTLLLFAGLALAVSMLLIGMKCWNRNLNPERADQILTEKGIETVARIQVDNQKYGYFFIASGKTTDIELDLKFPHLLENGMPLSEGDEFIVRFVPGKPRIQQIDFSRPTENQLRSYFARAEAKYAQLHPDISQQLLSCLTQAAFELEGVGGLADFVFQETSPEENPTHNRQSFQRLVRGVPFQKLRQEKCW